MASASIKIKNTGDSQVEASVPGANEMLRTTVSGGEMNKPAITSKIQAKPKAPFSGAFEITNIGTEPITYKASDGHSGTISPGATEVIYVAGDGVNVDQVSVRVTD